MTGRSGARGSRPATRPRPAAGTAVLAAALALTACTSGSDERPDPAGGGSSGRSATIEAFPDRDAPAASTPTAGRPAPPDGSSDTSSQAVGDQVVVTFSRAVDLSAEDRETIRSGGVPATLREPEGPAASTRLVCPRARRQTVEVPSRRDGFLRLRASVRTVARLSGDRAFTVLSLQSDRAVLLGLGREGQVRSRADATQIDERWFVREVLDCR